ncbi:MAG: glutamine--fructose-6-phosphate transaminase (isomerizing) [Candidatus Uhrbacteria bacterium]
MCGIIGYIGPRKNIIQNVILPGLTALEERGYDSAGIASLIDGQLFITKTVGKLQALREHNDLDKMSEATLSIGHTRWATHGGVTVPNAHPHTDCLENIALVHNGIIENFSELRSLLISQDHTFKSETDSEVVAHLIEEAFNSGIQSLEAAVQKAVSQLRGTWGLVVMAKNFPNEIVVARHGSPILLGIGEQEMFIASLEDAFINHTKRFIVVPEDCVCTVTSSGYNGETQTIRLAEDEVATSPEPFSHFMLKEINEQPDTVLRAINNGARLLLDDGSAKLGGLEGRKNELLSAKHLRGVACGTAKYATELGLYWLEEYGGFDSLQTVPASEVRAQLFPNNCAVLAVSQSGETHDTLQCIKEAKKNGLTVFSIINRVGKAIARETGCGVYTNAGPEKAVASTKVFLAQSVVFLLLTLWFGRNKEKMNRSQGRELGRALLGLSEQIAQTIKKTEEQTKKLAQILAATNDVYFIGRGPGAVIAKEGALKIKEVAYLHAEAYEAGELKHGPIALLQENFPVVGIVLDDEKKNEIISNLQEVKARGARTIVIAPEGVELPASAIDEIIRIPASHYMTSPLLAVIPLQLLAYYTALARNYDPDRPRNLAKSVTVA